MGRIDSEFQQAFLLHQRGQLDAAEKIYRSILRAQPKYFNAIYALGIVHLQRDEFREAEKQFSLAAKLDPNNAPLYNNRGSALLGLNRREEALESYDRSLALQPQNPEALYNRGNVLAALNRYEDALASYDNSLALFPDNAQAHNNRGSVLASLRRYREALASFDRAIRLNPNHAHAYANRGSAHAHLKHFDKAFDDLSRALSLHADLDYAFSDRLTAKMKICRWDEYEQDVSRILRGIRDGTMKVGPFTILNLPSTPLDQRKSAEQYVRDKAAPQKPVWRGERYAHDRIRIGYVSSDFHNHATSHLMAGMLEAHDRSRFEITAFSLRDADEDDYRDRVSKACDTFVPAAAMSIAELIQRIRASEIDILLDLHGHTTGNRINIFAARPAPVQVNYLGYPGTSGASYIDYIIADRHIIPETDTDAYSEKIVYLPDSYQPNDRKRVIADKTPSRKEAGLPEIGFVFCCFNNSYKITPDVFEIWMRLLKAVDGSVLWLFRDDATAAENLKREAERRGISASRLVFADGLPLAGHLARHRLADVFLDTLYYNAHTTCSDALWTGLPLVTCTGPAFAGRVATSLLHAAGVPEFVTASHEEYERLALKLATNPDLLRELKTKLANNRDTCPLFDTVRYTRHIEAAYLRMWEISQKGKSPQAFAVDAQ